MVLSYCQELCTNHGLPWYYSGFDSNHLWWDNDGILSTLAGKLHLQIAQEQTPTLYGDCNNITAIWSNSLSVLLWYYFMKSTCKQCSLSICIVYLLTKFFLPAQHIFISPWMVNRKRKKFMIPLFLLRFCRINNLYYERLLQFIDLFSVASLKRAKDSLLAVMHTKPHQRH